MAIIERELRRFRRSPFLIVMSLIFPLVQLIVLGYAFGGNVKNLTVAIVDQDGGLPAVKVRELAGAVAANARTFDTVAYASEGQALEALRDGRVNGVLTIPPDYSRRVVGEREPRLALIEDNTDNFVAATLAGSMNGMVAGLNEKRPSADRVASGTMLDVVELYPYVPYVQYLLPGSITMSIFMMVMIGGGIIFIDDKARGLHEGYLVTPITRLELIAGVPDPLDPMRMWRMTVVITITSLALVSMMFLLMVRVKDPLMPRAIFGLLNTLLYFPSGAVYPQQAFPGWMKAIAIADPFTYSVHAFKSLLLKNTGFSAIAYDLAFLMVFSAIAMTAATLLFRRSL